MAATEQLQPIEEIAGAGVAGASAAGQLTLGKQRRQVIYEKLSIVSSKFQMFIR
jgi:hypothetical protein